MGPIWFETSDSERCGRRGRSQVTHYDHSYVVDLMDRITGMKPAYQAEWMQEYTPYRMGSALGRWMRSISIGTEYTTGYATSTTAPMKATCCHPLIRS